MKDITSLLAIFIIVVVMIVLMNVIAQSLESDSIGDFYFLWSSSADSTFFNESGLLNLTLARISDREDASFRVTYQGGDNDTDRIYLNGNLIGYLDGTSPDVITVNPSYLAVTTEVNYTINATATNITGCNLTYYAWNGCNADQETCLSLNATRNITRAFLIIFAIIILFFGLIILVSIVGGLAQKTPGR